VTIAVIVHRCYDDTEGAATRFEVLGSSSFRSVRKPGSQVKSESTLTSRIYIECSIGVAWNNSLSGRPKY
jgi:hypothetical protein